MKSSALLLMLLALAPARADDWTASDGTTYKNVKVLSHDAAYVTILDDDGGGKVPLRLLNADLQKKFGYDPAKASALEAAAEAQDKADHAALVKEQLAEEAARRNQVADATPSTPPPAPVKAPPPPTNESADAQQVSSPSTDADAPKPALDADQRKALEDQIAGLQADIDFMQSQEAKVSRTSNGGDMSADGEHRYNHGGYDAKIADDQKQISDLQAQLNGN